MNRRAKTLFAAYAAALIVLFVALAVRYSSPDVPIPSYVESLEMPGTIVALWTVGVHSGFLIPASSIANVAIYFLVPFLFYRLVQRSRATRVVSGAVVRDAGRTSEDVSGRELVARNYRSPDELLKDPTWPTHRFVGLVAWDAKDAPVELVASVARHLIQKGCVYFCAWGPGCERVHDIFDEVDLELNSEPRWIISTWHDDQPLSEALWFALNNTTPDEEFVADCKTVIGIAIGNDTWAAEIQEAFKHPRKFNERVLESK